jgi:hypothetical protein
VLGECRLFLLVKVTTSTGFFSALSALFKQVGGQFGQPGLCALTSYSGHDGRVE